MKTAVLFLTIGFLTLGASSLLAPKVRASDPYCPNPGWYNNMTATGSTCEQAKDTLRNNMLNSVQDVCGPDNLLSYSIYIQSACSQVCGNEQATGNLSFCCGDDM